MDDRKPALLIVDDEPFNQLVICDFLDGCGYQLDIASSGEEAWEKLQANPDKYDTVLLDRMMPGMNGIDVLRHIKQDQRLKLLPVIMQTAASEPEEVAEGLEAGAYYYLTKPFRPEIIRAVIATALRDRSERILESHDSETLHTALCHLSEGLFTFRTTESARHISTLLSCLCPSPQIAHMGLMELMLNAIEHGNLGITYEEKSRLITENRLHEEISMRLGAREYADKTAVVKFKRTDTELIFTIKDEGKGFDWNRYLDMGMDRIMDNHGRGIAMSRNISFSKLEYRGIGNCVEATIYLAGMRGE